MCTKKEDELRRAGLRVVELLVAGRRVQHLGRQSEGSGGWQAGGGRGGLEGGVGGVKWGLGPK